MAQLYGYCVDFLHGETYKILGGLNRTDDIVAEGHDEEEDEK